MSAAVTDRAGSTSPPAPIPAGTTGRSRCRRRTPGSLVELEPDPRKGATTLRPSAVTTAVCEEIESYRGVRGARARLLHDERHPDLVLDVDLDARADVAATRARIESEAVPHTRQALRLDDLPTRLTLRPGSARRPLGAGPRTR